MEKWSTLVTRDFYWDKLTQYINDYLQSCDECQHNKSPQYARWGLHRPLATPYTAWTSNSTYFITQLPESQADTHVMVVVDLFTKIAHFISLPMEATAKDIAIVFLSKVWKLHSLPTEIISDINAKSSRQFWESLCWSLGIK